MTPALSAREASVLRYVRETADVEISLSVRDVAQHEGIGISKAHKVLTSLIEAGFLSHEPRKARSIRPAGHVDLRAVPAQRLRAELARRGETLDAMRADPIATGHRARRGGGICAADTCGAVVPVGHLMCRQHWFALPFDLQNGLKRAHAEARRSQSKADIARYQELLTTARDLVDGCGAPR
jgi:hypothetical protein